MAMTNLMKMGELVETARSNPPLAINRYTTVMTPYDVHISYGICNKICIKVHGLRSQNTQQKINTQF